MNNAHRTVKVSFFLGILVCAFCMPCGCDRGTEPASTPTTKPAAAGKPIVIGAVMPLTGDGAKYGERARNAIELALSELNAAGGIDGAKVSVIYEDSEGVPQKGVSAIQKLITLDRVPAVIGGLFSSVTLAMAPVAERKQVVILSPTSSTPKLTDAGDYIFRNCASDLFEGQVMAEAALTKLGISTVAILRVNNDYGVGITDVFREHFTAAGGKIVAEEVYQQGDTNLRAQITKLGAADPKPEAIYMVGYKELGQALKQSAELGVKAQFLSTVMFEDPEILKIAGSAAEGVIYSARAYDADSKDPAIQAFVKSYKERYGDTPDIFAAFSYDSMRILALAMKSGGTSSAGIKDALYEIKDFPGACGPTSFDKNGDVTQPAFLKTVRNGRFCWLNEDGPNSGDPKGAVDGARP